MLKLSSSLLLTASIFPILGFCSNTITAQNLVNLTKDSIQFQTQSAEAMHLGQGYDLFTSNTRSQCLDKSVGYEYVGSSSAEAKVLSDYSFDELLKEFGVSTTVEGGYEGFGASASVDFARTATKTDNALSVVYAFGAESFPMQLKELKTDTLISPYITRVNNHYEASDQIYDICGNQFVNQIDLGASLRLNMRYRFRTHEAKEIINASLAGRYLDFAQIKLAIDNLTTETKKNTQLELSVQQIGGDVSQLGKAIGQDVVSCGLDKMDSCLTVLRKFIDYQANDFANQLKRDDSQHPVGYNWAITGYHFKPYKEQLVKYSGHDNTQGAGVYLTSACEQQISPAIRDMRSQLVASYGEQIKWQQTYTDSKNLATTPYQLEALSQVKTSLDSNLQKVKSAGLTCFESPEICLQSGNDALNSLDEFNKEPLSIEHTIQETDFEETYPLSQWALVGAHQNPGESHYVYLPDFGYYGQISQQVSLDSAYDYDFYADVEVEPFDEMNTEVELGLYDERTNELLLGQHYDSSQKVKTTLRIHVDKGFNYHSAVIKLSAKNGLTKVKRIYNTKVS